MKKTIIKINYKRLWLLYVYLGCFAFLGTILLPLLIFDLSRDTLFWKTMYFGIVSIEMLIFILLSLSANQTAELSENGIFIRSKIHKIKTIKWSELKRVCVERISTGAASSKGTVYLEWIVLYTDSNQKSAVYGVSGSRRKGPWYIAGTIENIDILKEYLEKYNKDAIINL